MSGMKRHGWLYGIFVLVLAANALFWTQSRPVKARWSNVPPTPGYHQVILSSVGDKQLAYRSISMMLQNLGSVGGDVRPLAEYNYKELAQWFFLTAELDEHSNFMPYLAAYYYGAGQDTEKLREMMPYLYHVGSLPYQNKWMWLAQGAFLSRHRIKDFELAMEFADKLASLDRQDLPIWTKQMPAFIRYAQGEKEAAYDIMKQIMISGADTLPPQEIFAMKTYICTKILDESAAAADPLCQN